METSTAADVFSIFAQLKLGVNEKPYVPSHERLGYGNPYSPEVVEALSHGLQAVDTSCPTNNLQAIYGLLFNMWSLLPKLVVSAD